MVFSYPTCSSPLYLPLGSRFEHHLPVPRRLTSISEVGNSNGIRVCLNDAPRAPSPLAFADLSIPLTELGGSTFATSFHARRTLISPNTWPDPKVCGDGIGYKPPHGYIIDRAGSYSSGSIIPWDALVRALCGTRRTSWILGDNVVTIQGGAKRWLTDQKSGGPADRCGPCCPHGWNWGNEWGRGMKRRTRNGQCYMSWSNRSLDSVVLHFVDMTRDFVPTTGPYNSRVIAQAPLSVK